MKLDAIVILSAGTVLREGRSGLRAEDYRSTTFDEGDSFGVLGGAVRVRAAALLARNYPDALLVPAGSRPQGEPSHAAILAGELEGLGVRPDRIVLEEGSVNTLTQIRETMRIAIERGWNTVLYVTNEYQVERVRAFIERVSDLPRGIEALCQAAEPVIMRSDPSFEQEFERIRTLPPYAARVSSEAAGVQAIREGTYRPAPSEDKQERDV